MNTYNTVLHYSCHMIFTRPTDNVYVLAIFLASAFRNAIRLGISHILRQNIFDYNGVYQPIFAIMNKCCLIMLN